MTRPIALVMADARVNAATVDLLRARQRLEHAEESRRTAGRHLPPGRECGHCGAPAYRECDKSKH